MSEAAEAQAASSTLIAEEVLGFQRNMTRRGIIFSFTGYISEGILKALGDALRQKIRLESTDTKTVNRVFSVFVEQVQNIIRYSAERIEHDDEPPVELSSGMITVGSENGRFFVICGNVIGRKDADTLAARLRELAAMDSDELRRFYKEKLREPPDEGSKGGSIGLIEIARRASEPIQFDFQHISDAQSYFVLKAYI
ncbi:MULTISPECIES: SiaB family protein kinase [unclassified Thioalkalivibrio]|uniref:SiaB family protein kinase n=1 Tax=unclassified Thioalkalivibrio TaxID=2621013 RepID=UPI00036A6A07|nr:MULTISPECIES: SiaB family protein kinase [unclassified Thioalkalivibrio]